ncbi:T9SS type A sorting domain-containing protein [Chitinophaga sp.]|uniref:T9SS type A sorting domain-containing protein n=1 Tax=Chitinophaga sp. TaxID=1869181 RepID=UPI0031E21538
MIPRRFVNFLSATAAVTLSIQVSAQGLIISDGGNLVVKDSAKIVVNNGGIANSGIFNGGNGSVVFTGSLPATVSGSSITYFNTITLSKSTGTLTLLQHSGANGQVNMVAGNIDLNGYNLDLGNTGILNGETAAAHVIGPNGGFLIRTADISAGGSVNPGNLGMIVTPTSNLGLTVIKRGQQALQAGSNNSINRFYDVAATNGTSGKEDITFHYFDNELNGNLENELAVYYIKSPDTPGIWRIPYAADVNNNTIQINNDSFNGRYIIGNNNVDSIIASPLSGELYQNRAQLSWTTRYERNTFRFELQRSSNNNNFRNIATLPAAGNSNSTLAYSYTEPTSVADVWSYRYKIIFTDSTYKYSNIVTLTPAGYPNIVLQVTPNPTTGPLNIKFNSFVEQEVYVEVISNTGAMVTRKKINAAIGVNTVSIDISSAGAGTYYLKMVNLSDKAIKIIKFNP